MKPQKKASEMSLKELASYIDHSILKPDTTEEEIRKNVRDGVEWGCRTVCVNPSSIEIAAEICKGSSTGVCVVCDFPFGSSPTRSKALQAEEYCKTGAICELDIVANVGWIKSGKWA